MRILFSVFFLIYTLSAFTAYAQDLLDPANEVQVVDASVTTTKTDGELLVTVIGELRNTTNKKIDELIVEAKLMNSSGEVIDVINEPVYGLVIPAGQQVAFRLQAPAATDKNYYSGVKVRVVSGEQRTEKQKQKQKQKLPSRYLEAFITFLPMLIFILVWILMARKYSGKDSNPAKMLIAIYEQNVLLEKQVTALEAIASALNKQKEGGDI